MNIQQEQQQHQLINATAQNSTLQNYLVNNHIVNNSSDHNMKNVHVQIIKQEHNGQRYVINRQLVASGQLQHQEPLMLYWTIVEIESNNEINCYALVESKDIFGTPKLETLTTGKLLVANINGKQRRATVVMASHDKNFIFAEFAQLNKMAEENLKLREIQSRKRRRISGSDTTRKEIEDDSSLSAWSGISQNVNTERVVSPSPQIQSKKSYCPPMNYDQGTQTDAKITGNAVGSADITETIKELQKLIEINEHLLNEHKSLKNETKMNRFLLESFSDEFSSIQKSIQAIETKIESASLERVQYESLPQDASKKKILNGSGTQQTQQQPFFIIETAVQDAENASMSLTNGSNLEYTVEELQADESDRSASRISFHDQTSMMSNTSIEVKKERQLRRSHSSSNFSNISSTPLARSNSSSNFIEEWADLEGDVVIGINQTTVPVHILRSIDWKNFKAATRKLLVSLFPRSILASRSLTGRPSPAFHDRNKPVKEKLDPNIINDIIQIITRKCGVHESQVRTAITTKCADENKMLRSREAKPGKGDMEERFKAPSNMNDGDKENIINGDQNC